MRICGGKMRGRTFFPPVGKWPTRPTTDIARQGLFNILTNHLRFENISALDLFGGSGAHSLELVSRGCERVVYVDRHRPCVNFVRKIITDWGIPSSIEISHMDYLSYVQTSNELFDYIFAGPPYGLAGLDDIPDQILQSRRLKPGGLFVLEHNPHHEFTKHSNYWKSTNYGQTIFSFFTG
ncbi:MAG: RsmD family RNA methyltransferase [Saprospiraceae bacterium]|jgi:16S rRNA (guanine(966)-N(2))-methyltransferase RsmD|nr:RsmD family RNA methyltransferase [Saprospiraceae bacterium]MBP9209672.1 RsmD family RNA methyltransferase [Saprospiraceae bacterium]MBV6471967.1 Ribosomal RNA small subunit methyltransferase D [Saprospiraceae bacterium]